MPMEPDPLTRRTARHEAGHESKHTGRNTFVADLVVTRDEATRDVAAPAVPAPRRIRA
jgi:hypothetical protein